MCVYRFPAQCSYLWRLHAATSTSTSTSHIEPLAILPIVGVVPKLLDVVVQVVVGVEGAEFFVVFVGVVEAAINNLLLSLVFLLLLVEAEDGEVRVVEGGLQGGEVASEVVGALELNIPTLHPIHTTVGLLAQNLLLFLNVFLFILFLLLVLGECHAALVERIYHYYQYFYFLKFYYSNELFK